MELNIREKLPNLPNDKLPALVFVHGAWHGAWCWEEHFLPFFAKHGFECYAFDLPNHGLTKTEKGINKHRISDYVICLKSVIAKINKPCVLIGHSMGGYIIQQYLEKEDCEATVLLASVPSEPIWRLLFKMIKTNPYSMFKAFFTLNLTHLINSPKKAQRFLFSADLSNEEVQRYLALMSSESMKVIVFDFLLSKLNSRKNKTFPVLVQCAEKDEMVSIEENKRTAKMQDADFQMIKNISHDVMLDPNWNVSASNLLQWLKKRFPSVTAKTEEQGTNQENPKVNVVFPDAVPNLITNLSKKIQIDADKTKILGLGKSKRDN